MKKNIYLILLVIFSSLFLTTGFAFADTPIDKPPPSPLIDCTVCGPTTCTDTFLITSATANYPNDTVIACSARVRIPDKVVLLVYMEIKWNSQDLVLDSIRFPIGTGTIQHQGSDSINFRVDVPDQTYPNRTTLAKLWFKARCFSTSNVMYVKHCQETYFVEQGGQNWGPNFLGLGQVTRNAPPHTMKPLRDSSTVNDTIRMPVIYSCTTTASLGFVSTWEYPKDSLDFIDVRGGPLLLYNNPFGTPDESTDPAKLKITYTNNAYRSDVADTIFYIRFKNTMGKINSEAKVVRLTDTLKFCDGPNSDVLSIITNRDSANARTFYKAEFKFQNTSAVKGTQNVTFPTQLSNNFPVRLKDSSEVSRFVIDNSLWDGQKITWVGWENANTNRKWQIEAFTGNENRKYKNDPFSPENIPKSATLVSTVNQKVDVGQTTGTQNANVRDDNYTKLRDAISQITITAATGITLTTGTFTVTDPPPPPSSCPFLYTWDGAKFLEDNDILTTSEFTVTGTPVTDYYKISQPLVEQNGQYLLQLREVEDEESFVDELALVTVDHPQSVKVGVTPEGKIVAYDQALFPVACVDQEGKDHLDKILTNDGVIFEGDGPAALLLTFNKPSKLELINDARAKGAPGDDGNGPPPPKDGFGLSTKLTVEIEDANGQWHDLGVVAPRVNAQGSFWILGSTGIDLGEQFRVKLYWDKRYSVDRLAYYVPTEKPWYQESLRLTQAGHSKKMDVTSLVSAYDGNSAKLIPGEIISMAFPAGKPVPDGMVRDFIFKSVGYYIPYDRASAAGPFTYKLHSNYPNPFNAQTEIQYALPEPSEVNLSVYNIMGQKVRTLAEGRQSAGVHKVIWDGKNENGETVASGVYFYTIRAGVYVETKKMTLLK